MRSTSPKNAPPNKKPTTAGSQGIPRLSSVIWIAGAGAICNGFKDHDYLASASAAVRLGKKVVVVIEKPFAVDQIVRIAAREEFLPMIGFRIRLQSKGSGCGRSRGDTRRSSA